MLRAFTALCSESEIGLASQISEVNTPPALCRRGNRPGLVQNAVSAGHANEDVRTTVVDG